MSSYNRPEFGRQDIAYIESRSVFAPGVVNKVPCPDYPISPVENFRLAAARKTPVWLPNSTLDFQSIFAANLLEGFKIFPWGSTEPVVHKDEFGCQWQYVVSAGGSMLDPHGRPVMDDITLWEKQVRFPEIKFNDSDFLENTYDPKRVLHVNVFQGATERLVALMGSYSEAMVAMASEPEACSDFFNAFSDWEVSQIDKLFEKYPIDLITYHDDWGTERDTFFSERMMEELVLEPTRRIVSCVKKHGAAFELHSCGCIGRFLKYMIEVGIDFLQLQERANDIPAMKRDFGNKIGFCVFSSKLSQPDLTDDEQRSAVRELIKTYGRGGGAYTSTFGSTPEKIWNLVFELYCASREYYDADKTNFT